MVRNLFFLPNQTELQNRVRTSSTSNNGPGVLLLCDQELAHLRLRTDGTQQLDPGCFLGFMIDTLDTSQDTQWSEEVRIERSNYGTPNLLKS